ncbi:MAG: LemA family protein [candidate division CPR1 bacterium ADurb.Bin160]|uniref:LemA family protein n=1 Tax=candidate division CPR1 bacterium ADurb.Bin160 TaxID=1852826 RepID=A0A1V5ZQY7_9BACT|nr:MAG: LemA family protein [candidate division CPR1 bacterium ADurb.Bin160]
MGQYNTLVKLDEVVKTQRGQVESVYQRRADLIPNIVATVKGEADFEQKTLTQVIEARANAIQLKVDVNNAEEFVKFQEAQGELSQALGRLMVLTENYPSLRANQAFSDLRVQLEGSENRISVERMNYNETVKNYNTKLRTFPTNIIAGLFGFEKANLFEATEGSEVAPVVEF